MGQVADRGNFDHPRTALEGVQVAQQGFHFLTVLRVRLPTRQRRTGAVDDVEPFLKEDFQQFRIVIRRILCERRRVRFGGANAVLAPLLDGLDQRRAITQWLLLVQLLQQLFQAVVAALQQQRQLGAVAETPIHQPLIQAFQLMGQVTDRPDLGHPRPPLEGMQVALQRRQGRAVLRVSQPALQGLPGTVQNIHGLFEEDRHHFIVGVECRGPVLFQPGRGAAQLGDAQGAATLATNQAQGGRIKAFIEQIT
ncbi:hypothetical protein D3C85_591560 [compost metagenome]